MNKLTLTVVALSYLGLAKADDFLKGVKGPTNMQIDARATYSINEKSIESVNSNAIFKYWNKDNDWWAFANIPYRFTNKGDGIGDINIGAGPRFSIDDMHFLPYSSLTIPTAKDGLGNNRTDIKIGANSTYWNKTADLDITAVMEYSITGKSSKGINPSNELYAGGFIGKGIGQNLRLGAGIMHLAKGNGDHDTRFRAGLRWTFSKNLHMEAIYDRTVSSKAIPRSESIGVYVRANL